MVQIRADRAFIKLVEISQKGYRNFLKSCWKKQNPFLLLSSSICDRPQDFNAKGESTRTTRFHFKTKEFILTRFSTLAILPH